MYVFHIKTKIDYTISYLRFSSLTPISCIELYIGKDAKEDVSVSEVEKFKRTEKIKQINKYQNCIVAAINVI